MLCALKRCVSSSLHLNQDYTLVLLRHGGQTAVLQDLAFRSYEIKQLLNNRNFYRHFFVVDVVDNVD